MWGGIGKGTYSVQVLFWEKFHLKFHKYLGGVEKKGLVYWFEKNVLNTSQIFTLYKYKNWLPMHSSYLKVPRKWKISNLIVWPYRSTPFPVPPHIFKSEVVKSSVATCLLYVDRSNYGMSELFHKASVFGKKRELYEVELTLGTTRVFTFEVLV